MALPPCTWNRDRGRRTVSLPDDGLLTAERSCIRTLNKKRTANPPNNDAVFLDVEVDTSPVSFPISSAATSGAAPAARALFARVASHPASLARPAKKARLESPSRRMLEINAVFSLNHRFAANPDYRAARENKDYTPSVGPPGADVHQTLEEFAPVDNATAGGPLITLERAARIVDAGLVAVPRTVTPTHSPMRFNKNMIDGSPLANVATAKMHHLADLATAIAPIEDPRAVSPNSSPERFAQEAGAASSSDAGPSDLVPTRNDPRDESFRATFYSDKDDKYLNRGHILLRKKLAELRRTRSGRIYFQCIGCQHLPRKERITCSTKAPRSIKSLYRHVVSFMMNHVYACPFISQADKDICKAAKQSRMKTSTKEYWRTSAKAIGLRDGEEGRGIVFCEPFEDL